MIKYGIFYRVYAVWYVSVMQISDGKNERNGWFIQKICDGKKFILSL